MMSENHSGKLGWFFFMMILIGIASLYISAGYEEGMMNKNILSDSAMAIARMFQFPLFNLERYFKLDFINGFLFIVSYLFGIILWSTIFWLAMKFIVSLIYKKKVV